MLKQVFTLNTTGYSTVSDRKEASAYIPPSSSLFAIFTYNRVMEPFVDVFAQIGKMFKHCRLLPFCRYFDTL